MFFGDESLININLSTFDTSNVNSIEYMFSGCKALFNLDLSNFDTSRVTSLVGFFDHCSNLTYIDISNFSSQSLIDKDYYNFFLDKTPNGTVLYDSNLFSQDLINTLFDDWEKLDINNNKDLFF